MNVRDPPGPALRLNALYLSRHRFKDQLVQVRKTFCAIVFYCPTKDISRARLCSPLECEPAGARGWEIGPYPSLPRGTDPDWCHDRQNGRIAPPHTENPPCRGSFPSTTYPHEPLSCLRSPLFRRVGQHASSQWCRCFGSIRVKSTLACTSLRR